MYILILTVITEKASATIATIPGFTTHEKAATAGEKWEKTAPNRFGVSYSYAVADLGTVASNPTH